LTERLSQNFRRKERDGKEQKMGKKKKKGVKTEERQMGGRSLKKGPDRSPKQALKKRAVPYQEKKKLTGGTAPPRSTVSGNGWTFRNPWQEGSGRIDHV